MFYEIDIRNENIHLFDSSNDLITEKMIVKELNYKEIIDLIYGYNHFIARTKMMKFIAGVIIISDNRVIEEKIMI